MLSAECLKPVRETSKIVRGRSNTLVASFSIKEEHNTTNLAMPQSILG